MSLSDESDVMLKGRGSGRGRGRDRGGGGVREEGGGWHREEEAQEGPACPACALGAVLAPVSAAVLAAAAILSSEEDDRLGRLLSVPSVLLSPTPWKGPGLLCGQRGKEPPGPGPHLGPHLGPPGRGCPCEMARRRRTTRRGKRRRWQVVKVQKCINACGAHRV